MSDPELEAATAEATEQWRRAKQAQDSAKGPVVVGPSLLAMVSAAQNEIMGRRLAEAEAAQREAEARAEQEAQEAEAALKVAPTIVPEATPEPAVTPDVLKALMKLIRATPPEIEGG
jgi:hypothetical protein